jgi:hypothetical protein
MFQDSLNQALHHVPEARGALLIGLDGITVARAFEPGEEALEPVLVTMTVELANVLRKYHRFHDAGELPRVQDLRMTTDDFTMICHLVDEYLLVLAVPATTSSTTATRMLRLLAPRVLAEIA